MLLNKLKPTTPAKRHKFTAKKSLSKKNVLKLKTKMSRSSLGRDSKGSIVTGKKERGSKHKFRVLELFRWFESKCVVCSVEHDPNRTAYIAAVYDSAASRFYYILAPNNIKEGDVLFSGKKIFPSTGDSAPLRSVQPGTVVHNVSTAPYKAGQVSRAAGTSCLVLTHYKEKTLLELPSLERRFVESRCFATVGRVSNKLKFLETSGKAGRSRWLGIRPKVRGVAMNPVDHPNGGGEGKKSGFGRTPWGKPGKRGRTSRSRCKFILKRYYEQI